MTATPAAPRVKPRLRGVSHQIAFFVAIPAGVALVAFAPGRDERLAAAIFAGSLVLLLGVSALLHRPMWRPRPREVIGRIDEAAIFVLIAGTYTPMCLLAMAPGRGRLLLAIAWGGALVGVVQALAWPQASRGLKSFTYVALGWCGLMAAGDMARLVGIAGIGLVVVGGVLYSVGAAIYALRRPDPLPAVFGYHEIFHLLVIVAATCHFIAIAMVITRHAGASG